MNTEDSERARDRSRRGGIRRVADLLRAALPARPLRIAAIAALALLAVVAVVGAGGFLALKSGLEGRRLNDQVEKAVASLVRPPLRAELGSTRLSLDGASLLALEVAGVTVRDSQSGVELGSARLVRLGIDPWELLSGNVRIGSARVSGVRLAVGALPAGTGAGGSAGLFDARGRIDPDRVAPALFAFVGQLFDAFEMRETKLIRGADIRIALPGAPDDGDIVIESAEIGHADSGKLAFSGRVLAGEKVVELSGAAVREATRGRIDELTLDVSNLPLPGRGMTGDAGAGAGSPPLAIADLHLSAGQGGPHDPDHLAVDVGLSELVLPAGAGDAMRGTASLRLSLLQGEGKVEIERAHLSFGHSTLDFHGAVGPMPASQASDPVDGLYRFELVSDGSVLAPEDSPEPPLSFAARAAGTYDHGKGQLSVDNLGVRSEGGELVGKASAVFGGDASPAVFLAIRVPEMPLSHVKQLWPASAGPSARRWVLDNVFGGTVRDSRLEFSVVSGRLGSDDPLRPDEIFGHFQIDETRFDSAGDIPPVRDAFGAIDFRGSEVEITLSKGTAYLPSGRSVSATNGSMAIDDAGRQPVIGLLDIDVAGEADAIAELAAAEPLNALRHVDFGPDDLSGEVSGHVRGEIPLGPRDESRELDWQVELEYEHLAIARPFDGQLVTEAAGSLVVNPRRAIVKARAKLNGLPATVDLVEPLDAAERDRRRSVTVTLDEKARTEMAPGLDAIVKGPVLVDMASTGEQTQQVTADLADAVIELPWIGWRKGAGIAATATFVLTRDGDETTLSDFRLRGDTFAADGRIVIVDGELSRGDFSYVRLNRGDDFGLRIARSGEGYDVSVSGRSADLRSVVKLYSGHFTDAAGSFGDTRVTLDIKLERANGFNDETFSAFSLGYRGTGSSIDRLGIEAMTVSGQGVNFSLGKDEGGRALSMRSRDAGAVLRFLDAYDHLEGGTIEAALRGDGDRPLTGTVDIRDFWLVNEPSFSSLVSAPSSGDGRNLAGAMPREIDVSRVYFDLGHARVELGSRHARLGDGILRGPTLGTSFQGTLYDGDGHMSVSGTFMPAYGINSAFAGIPLVGRILGNGAEGGIIGITYKLEGKASSPRLTVNPISVIAPGVFRSIFKFR